MNFKEIKYDTKKDNIVLYKIILFIYYYYYSLKIKSHYCYCVVGVVVV